MRFPSRGADFSMFFKDRTPTFSQFGSRHLGHGRHRHFLAQGFEL